MTRRGILILSIAVIGALVASLQPFNRASGRIRVTASSGSDPSALLTGGRSSDRGARDDSWRTTSETVGAWIELSYPEPTRVDHVEVLGPSGTSTGFTSAMLTFDVGASLLLTADRAGDATVAFPGRTVSHVRLTIAGVTPEATSVALTGVFVDGAGDWRRAPDGEPMVATTSSNAGAPASALADGKPARGDTATEWTAAAWDQAPWAELSWKTPREIASVQVFGPSSPAADAPAAQLHGMLRFDDGSTVVVSAIARGNGGPTTVAFTPRIARSVRLEIDPTEPGTAVGLRELTVHNAGTTPPRWPGDSPRYATSPQPAESCDASSASVAAPASGRLTLVCPSPGSAVDGRAVIVVAADPQTPLQALAWSGVSRGGAGSVMVVASATAGTDGRAVLSVNTVDLLRGPLALRIQVSGQESETPLYVQLVNLKGRRLDATTSAPAGMTLQWDEEFTAPLSISRTGAGAEYAATKPDMSSSGQFGEATFADPASGAGTLTSVDGGYLRIRVRPAEDSASGTTAPRYLGGILSSAHIGGSGFSAQYGYFEARIMGAPGPGSWPAFWMLNTESVVRQSATQAEVDAVELYGHSALGSCHYAHNWGATEQPRASTTGCPDPNGFSDWAMAWHTYGVRIMPNGVTFFIDGSVVSTVTGLIHYSEPFFFMLDLALGSGWPIDLSQTAGVTDMHVDWVHVYT